MHGLLLVCCGQSLFSSPVMSREFLLLGILLASSCHSCSAATCKDAPFNTYGYCNTSMEIADRVADLVGRMTPDEKVSQLGNTAPAVDRLAIPAYQWWSEALHGLAGGRAVHYGGDLPYATSFPQVILLGATFNRSLIWSMAKVISTEARAFANKGQANLTFFAPNVNIFRDPRWGRGHETPGEDPYLSAQYAAAFVKGMQEGDDPRYLKVVTTCKHYDVYNLENYNGTDRHHFNAVTSDQDLVETYLPAFKSCVREGRSGSIMCSYNAVNGVPSCANDLLQNKIMRDEWGFEGYIVSDCGAISNIMSTHMYTKTPEDTVQAGLRGGCDLDCGSFYQKNGMDAYNKKTITDDDLNTAMTRLFTYRMKLGMFDPPEDQPYCRITPDQVNTPEHQALALDAARDGIVLLKNDGTLPLDSSKYKNIAVIGPNANATSVMQGNYHGTAPYLISPLEGIQKMTGVTVTYAEGCDVLCSSTDGFADATSAASKSDVAIVVIGISTKVESEGHDRTDLLLPGHQEDLLKQLKTAGKPMIVVVMSGGPVDISYAKDNANGVLWVGYPGQSGGQALADILFGMVNPSGRLPVTIYPADYADKISFFSMSMRDPPGRTYKFYTGTPVYQFGDGLSYTTFDCKWTELLSESPVRMSIKELFSVGSVQYNVTVTNTGKMAGATSVLAYVTSNVPGAPMKQLFDFQKVFLTPGQSVTILFTATPDTFSTVDSKGMKNVRPGLYKVIIGDLSHTRMLF